MSISPRLPVLLVGVTAVLAALAAFVLLRTSGSETTSAAPPSASSTPALADAPARPRPSARPTSPPVPTLPPPIGRALATSRTVVVTLFVPGAPLDAITRREALAGAEAAGVPHVALDLTRGRPTAELAQRFGATSTPTILVLQRGPKLATKLDGYEDRETVAQAAANAR